MIFRDLKGGIGNQLFIAINILEESRVVIVLTDLLFEQGDYTTRVLDKSIENILRKKGNVFFLSDFVPRFLRRFCRILLRVTGQIGDDYYQTGHHSSGVMSRLKRDLFNGIDNTHILSFMKQYDLRGSVAMHIRRGDFIDNTNEKHRVLESFYYNEALRYFPDDEIFIFTDDVEFCKRQYPHAVIVSDHSFSDLEELLLMSCFKSLVIANSTFSYWAAMFSDARVIAPKQLVKYEPNLFKEDWIWI